MKLLYLSTWDFSNEKSDGVCKKIYAQVHVFEKNGFEVDMIYIKDGLVIYKGGGSKKAIGKVDNIKKTPAYFQMYNFLKNKKYNWIYNRYGMMDTFYYQVLKQLRKNGAKILVEIPTYPYKHEKPKGFFYSLLFAWDQSYIHKLKKVFDRVITYSRDDYIFDIPTIQVVNGINISDIALAEKNGNILDDTINLLVVAYMQPYHGYERLLRGLKNYYANCGKRNIQCHFVGEGPEKALYERLVNQYELSDHVIFYGILSGRKLDDVFNICDIGICTLGGYKKELYLSSELKSREFLARGLPIVSGIEIDVFVNKNTQYYLQLPNDETDIDMIRIIHFYDKIYSKQGNAGEVRKAVRSMAEKYIDMSVTMLPVIEYIRKE